MDILAFDLQCFTRMEDFENYGILLNYIIDLNDVDFMSYGLFSNDFTNIDYIMPSDCLNDRRTTSASL